MKREAFKVDVCGAIIDSQCQDKISGVYTIRCKSNGRVYIGCSKDVISRINNHLCNMRYSHHGRTWMNQDYDFYGINNFLFRVEIIEHNRGKRLAIERQMIDEWSSLGILYNESPVAGFTFCNKRMEAYKSMLGHGI